MSHDCYTWTAQKANRYLGISQDDDFVSYLPLSHSAALMIDVFMPMACGGTVYFGDQNALKGSLVDTLRYDELIPRTDEGAVHLLTDTCDAPRVVVGCLRCRHARTR